MKQFVKRSFLWTLLVLLQYGAVEVFADPILEGPILASQSPLGEQITFQDLGTDRVWGLETPVRVYRLNSWTPDGCKVQLVKASSTGYQYPLMSITDLSMQELPPIGYPALWSLDGQSLLLVDYHSETDSTDVYFADQYGRNPQLVHSFDSWIGRVQWLSDDELLYLKGGPDGGYEGWFVWNITTGRIRPFYLEDEKMLEEISPRDFYNTDSISPDYNRRAGFYEMAIYRGALDTRINELTEAEVAQIKTLKPQVPGFDIFSLKESARRHIDVNGQFIQSLIWSPSGTKIAVTTDWEGSDFGIYVYDIEQDTLQRVADAQGAIAGLYTPSWSPDEEWLAFTTPEGYFIQRLSDGKRVQLDERLNGYTLYWSPVMDYSKSECN